MGRGTRETITPRGLYLSKRKKQGPGGPGVLARVLRSRATKVLAIVTGASAVIGLAVVAYYYAVRPDD